MKTARTHTADTHTHACSGIEDAFAFAVFLAVETQGPGNRRNGVKTRTPKRFPSQLTHFIIFDGGLCGF